jgi:hypothetical protein
MKQLAYQFKRGFILERIAIFMKSINLLLAFALALGAWVGFSGTTEAAFVVPTQDWSAGVDFSSGESGLMNPDNHIYFGAYEHSQSAAYTTNHC